LLRLSHISKSFGANRAVDDVSLEVRRGEIVALVGENGAGKTTLMRIAAGELAADAGTIDREGRLELVHQHFMLVPELTIAENLALTRRGFRFATRRAIEKEAEAMMIASGIQLRDLHRRAGELSVGEKSRLELIKAISRKPATLVLDEPTAVLTPSESQELFAVMRRLASEGTAIVFISHKLPEVMEVAERVVVMRRGKVVAETLKRDTTADALARAMVQTAPPPPGRRHPNITAIVGVSGNGQDELAESFREQDRDAAHIPPDRTRDGIVAEMTIAENLALRRIKDARRMIELYSIRASGPGQRAGDLSGGNQQKLILARELDARPRRIFASEPTRGLDIEATRFVHDQLRDAAERGAEITLITSDLDEAFALAGTIRVIYRGRLSDPMTAEEAHGRVARLMAGLA
jgi:general nucleoside transport system ATP-binding protein